MYPKEGRRRRCLEDAGKVVMSLDGQAWVAIANRFPERQGVLPKSQGLSEDRESVDYQYRRSLFVAVYRSCSKSLSYRETNNKHPRTDRSVGAMSISPPPKTASLKRTIRACNDFEHPPSGAFHQVLSNSWRGRKVTTVRLQRSSFVENVCKSCRSRHVLFDE